MTVAELIDALEKEDQDSRVMLRVTVYNDYDYDEDLYVFAASVGRASYKTGATMPMLGVCIGSE